MIGKVRILSCLRPLILYPNYIQRFLLCEIFPEFPVGDTFFELWLATGRELAVWKFLHNYVDAKSETRLTLTLPESYILFA